MKKIIIDKLITFITNNKQCTEKDIKIYRYGLETLYNLMTKTIVLLIITFFIKTIKQCLLIIMFYTLLRLFAYGIHANTSLGCWLTTLPIYIIGSLFIKYISVTKNIIWIMWVIYTLFVVLWAPADTKKRPLIHAKRRKRLKIEALIMCVVFYVFIWKISNPQAITAIGFSMLLESISICPLTYYLSGNRFNNYIYYNREHGLN